MLPNFLSRRFDEADLEASLSSTVALDQGGMIVWANQAWRRRAQELGIAETNGSTSYFEAILAPLRAVFEGLMTNALESNQVFELDYECPTPDEHRTFRLRALPIDGAGLLLEHSLRVARPAGLSEPALTSIYMDPSNVILHCGNCRRTRHPESGAWHWVADWIATPDRRSSHGICPTCESYFWENADVRTGAGLAVAKP